MFNALNALSTGLLTQTASSRIADNTDRNGSSGAQRSAGDQAVTDSVEISAEAQEIMQAQQAKDAVLHAKISHFQQFMPTHEGFSSYNLARGVVDPGAQPFSQHRPFDEVAQAARETLDKNYQKLEDIGHPYDPDRSSVTGESLFGEFDRRALYAIASNQGGRFNEEEQNMARNFMISQHGLAMGLYSGPSDLAGNFNSVSDVEQRFKAGITFLDQVSIEEKSTSTEWAYQRAVSRSVYEERALANGRIPQNFDIDHPLVKLIREGLDAWRNSTPDLTMTSDGDVSSVAELLDEPWFEPYADRLERAIEETRQLYGLDTE